jgi:hypothetical protein
MKNPEKPFTSTASLASIGWAAKGLLLVHHLPPQIGGLWRKLLGAMGCPTRSTRRFRIRQDPGWSGWVFRSSRSRPRLIHLGKDPQVGAKEILPVEHDISIASGAETGAKLLLNGENLEDDLTPILNLCDPKIPKTAGWQIPVANWLAMCSLGALEFWPCVNLGWSQAIPSVQLDMPRSS